MLVRCELSIASNSNDGNDGIMNEKEIRPQTKQKRFLLWGSALVLLCVLLVVVVYWGQRRHGVQPEYVFRYADNQSDDFPTTEGAKYFAQLVEERSGGRIVILIYSDAALGREDEVIDQLRYGGIDFARVSISQLAGVVPELNVLHLPYLYESSEHMWSVLDGEIGTEFLQAVSEQDMIGLSWYDAGSRNFYTVRPITCLEDMQGMRIRVQDSNLMSDVVTSLGAIPIPLAYDEVYSAIEVGNVDGAENSWPSYESMMHYEVAPYFTMDEHSRIPEMQLCSAHTWELLSEEDRELIKEAAEESALYERTLWAEKEISTREELEGEYVQVIELTPEEKKRFQDAVLGVYEKYCSDYLDLIQRIQNEGK